MPLSLMPKEYMRCMSRLLRRSISSLLAARDSTSGWQLAARLSHITLQAAGPAILFYQRQGYTSAKDLGPNPSWAEMEKQIS